MYYSGKIRDLHKSEMSISMQMWAPRPSVGTVVHKYKVHCIVVSLPRSERKLSLSAERKLVLMVRTNPQTTKIRSAMN